MEAVRRWPFARRIFGNLLEDRDFPALPDVLIEVLAYGDTNRT